MKIAINGFGRIGRTTTRAMIEKGIINQLVAVNDLMEPETLAHLLKYDSNYGTLKNEISAAAGIIKVDGNSISVLAEKEPANLPWGKLGIDVVLECTGRFTSKEGAEKHLAAGAKMVIVSAPVKDGVPTYILGVNDAKYAGEKVINNASCTTNCVAPVTVVIQANFGIAKAMMTTIHSFTAEQNLVDGPPPPMHKDLRRARSAATNIVPTTTGATIATTETIPEIKGLFDGLAIRVPTPTVSLADFTFVVKKQTSAEEVNEAFRQATKNPIYKNVLAVSEVPLVSSDFKGSQYSAIIDLPLTKVTGGDLVKVIAWYDNELGYSYRLVEEALQLGTQITRNE